MLIDLGRIPSLRSIQRKGDLLVVGAMSPHAAVASSSDVRAAIPALASLASLIGDPMVRNRGTIGGSIANSDPAADYPAAVVGLDAVIVTSQRRIGADTFFKGMFETALGPDEIITSVEFPVPRRAAYVKFRHPASRFALVGVFVAQTASGTRVAVTGAGSCVFRLPEMERALDLRFTPQSIENIKIPSEGLNADLQASAEYRANLVSIVAQRAVAVAAQA